MKITIDWLKKKEACSEGVEWFNTRTFKTDISVIVDLIADGKLGWANWAIGRIMKRKQYLAYVIFAAEQVLDIYEQKYPMDDWSRKAILAAKNVLKNTNPDWMVWATVVLGGKIEKGMMIRILGYGLKLLEKEE